MLLCVFLFSQGIQTSSKLNMQASVIESKQFHWLFFPSFENRENTAMPDQQARRKYAYREGDEWASQTVSGRSLEWLYFASPARYCIVRLVHALDTTRPRWSWWMWVSLNGLDGVKTMAHRDSSNIFYLVEKVAPYWHHMFFQQCWEGALRRGHGLLFGALECPCNSCAPWESCDLMTLMPMHWCRAGCWQAWNQSTR